MVEQETFAYVYGEAFTKLPDDLYIPPDALEVILQAFEGPLDLLLYLIRKKNVDVLDVSVSAVTSQYMEYVEVMRYVKLELAAEYLVMAALLGEIKSRSLLPRSPHADEDESDPKVQLLKRLQEYEQFKLAAEDLDKLPRLGRDSYLVEVNTEHIPLRVVHPEIDLRDLVWALRDILLRSDLHEIHQVEKEKLSVHDKMSYILDCLGQGNLIFFNEIFILEEGRVGIVVTFLSLLELVKNSLVSCVQAGPFQPIYVCAEQAALSQETYTEGAFQNSLKVLDPSSTKQEERLYFDNHFEDVLE